MYSQRHRRPCGLGGQRGLRLGFKLRRRYGRVPDQVASRWTDAFTPGNSHFSGNLPVLATNDSALTRNYYMGALTILILERPYLWLHPDLS